MRNLDWLYLRLLDLISDLESFSILMVILLGIGLVWTSWIYFNIWLDKRVKTLYAKWEARREEQEMGNYIEHQFDGSKKK